MNQKQVEFSIGMTSQFELLGTPAIPAPLTCTHVAIWGGGKENGVSSAAMSSTEGYVLVARCEVAGVTVQKFKSTRTGLVVCLAQVEGPLVEGFFCLGGYWSVYGKIVHSVT